MIVYVITNFYQDYEYPDATHNEIIGVYSFEKDAMKALKKSIEDTYNKDDWDSDEEYNEFIKIHMCGGEECFIDDSNVDRYIEIKITEVPFFGNLS